jgi:hypothetical protein
MSDKKVRWIIIAATAIALIIAAGITAGFAYAGTSTPTTAPTANTTRVDPQKTLYTKVATILGIDESKLESAFNQAQKDIQNEDLTNRLNSMVQNGTITQAQADAYLKWWQSRPDVADQIGQSGMMAMGGMGGIGRNSPGPGGNTPPSPTPTTTTK